MNLSRELAPPGKLIADQSFEFDFTNIEKKSESYNGINARLRYEVELSFAPFTLSVLPYSCLTLLFLCINLYSAYCTFSYFVKFVITRSFASNITAEQDIWVIRYDDPPEVDKPIKMEVGIEDCLHIEFEYLKSKYHLKDVVIGKIYFLLVRLKIKYMELALQKRETTGAGPSAYSETETLTKFEIMDGVPVKGESIPVRLFLGAFDLTPTYRNIQDKFTVKYTLNLVLVDEEDRRYFKQHEIQLWRKRPGTLLEQDATRHTARHAGSRPTEGPKKKRKPKKDAAAPAPSADEENATPETPQNDDTTVTEPQSQSEAPTEAADPY